MWHLSFEDILGSYHKHLRCSALITTNVMIYSGLFMVFQSTGVHINTDVRLLWFTLTMICSSRLSFDWCSAKHWFYRFLRNRTHLDHWHLVLSFADTIRLNVWNKTKRRTWSQGENSKRKKILISWLLSTLKVKIYTNTKTFLLFRQQKRINAIVIWSLRTNFFSGLSVNIFKGLSPLNYFVQKNLTKRIRISRTLKLGTTVLFLLELNLFRFKLITIALSS